MKLELIRNAENKVVGYKLIRESIEEYEAMERVRDMYFWGHLGKMKYDGRKSEKGTDDTVELRFVCEDHYNKQKQAEMEEHETLRKSLSSSD